MSTFVANARMYSVAPEAEAAWRDVLVQVCDDAGVTLDYVAYPAPLPLDALWQRGDLGCVQMCGYPIALRIADVVPIAAAIPRADWAGGQAVYRSDLIVKHDAPFSTIGDTFGGRIGWTVAHSHSGFNALRHHLLAHRTAARPTLYGEVCGNLVTARAVLDAVLDGRIDVGPLDGYWHMLIRHYRPDLTRGVRVLESTDTAPMPAFVASPAVPPAIVAALRAAFAAAHRRAWFGQARETLLIDGFVAVSHDTFAPTLEWHDAALRAGYPAPA